jgi:hypothetical protein
MARERRYGRPISTVRIEIWRADISRSLDVSETLIRQMTIPANDLEPPARDR